jgi:D-beta-D-heptose 7-phosphate kinase/D-beta-D-heptose 1-phosphate adenosyltransferase
MLGTLKAIEGCSGLNVLVLGDLMLDRVIRGRVERISPEAPVPVVHFEEERFTLGGACNVARNMARLGCRVTVLGSLGDDPHGTLMEDLLSREGISFGGIRTERPTTTKTRVVAHRHQLIRVDREETGALPSPHQDRLLAALEEALGAHPRVAVISDYAKGVCTPAVCGAAISRLRGMGVPVVVDPKGADWERYRGAFLVTPNLKELSIALGREVPNQDGPVEEAARQALERFGVDFIMVTRSEMGLSLVGPRGAHHHRSTAREVYDVTGAGDTAVAVFAALYGAGADMVEAALWANRAGGYAVGREGTYAVTREDLLSMLSLRGGGKLLSLAEAVQLAETWRRGGQTVVFTNGCFDVLHAGHVRCIRSARAMGDRLIVGLNSDQSVRRLKGPNRPVNPEELRAEVLCALEDVDGVVIFHQDTPLEIIRAIRPQVLVKGGDYRPCDIVGHREVLSWGGRVEVVPLLEGLSTTRIIERIRS